MAAPIAPAAAAPRSHPRATVQRATAAGVKAGSIRLVTPSAVSKVTGLPAEGTHSPTTSPPLSPHCRQTLPLKLAAAARPSRNPAALHVRRMSPGRHALLHQGQARRTRFLSFSSRFLLVAAPVFRPRGPRCRCFGTSRRPTTASTRCGTQWRPASPTSAGRWTTSSPTPRSRSPCSAKARHF